MGVFSRLRRRGDGSARGPIGRARERRAEQDEAERAIVEWIDARRGVEMFVEPRTTVTSTTMLLVAHDGEFTRRPVADAEAAEKFAREHTLPIYEAAVVGYPQRMRDYSRRQNLLRKRAERDRLDR